MGAMENPGMRTVSSPACFGRNFAGGHTQADLRVHEQQAQSSNAGLFASLNLTTRGYDVASPNPTKTQSNGCVRGKELTLFSGQEPAGRRLVPQ